MVDVLWVGSDGPCCWDQEFLWQLFTNDPAYNVYPDWQMVEVASRTEGAIVVFPAGGMDLDDVAPFNRELAKLPWVFLIGTSDENAEFPYNTLSHPNMVVWAMTSSGEGIDRSIVEFFPHATTAAAQLPIVPKAIDTLFIGQDTHKRRHECIKAMRSLGNGTISFGTKGFSQGLTQEDYHRLMRLAKVVPCPSGPRTPDSFRLFEALELGAVPLADNHTPEDLVKDWWATALPDAPFPIIENWATDLLPNVLEILAAYPRINNRVFAWWQQYKRRFAHDIAIKVQDLSGRDFSKQTPDDLITAVVTTSPITSNPSLYIIKRTIASIRSQLPLAEIIIVADGVRPELEFRRAPYEEFLRHLLHYANTQHNVVVLVKDEWGHQANAVRTALEEVRTPLVLHVEHDMTLEGEFDWPGIVRVALSDEVHVVRFLFEDEIKLEHRHLMLDDSRIIDVDGVPLVRTSQWSTRPHVIKTSMYRHIIHTYFGLASRTMVEDGIYGPSQALGWGEFRVHIYAGNGLRHGNAIDARYPDSKFDMIYEYDTEEIPFGAPYPTSLRPVEVEEEEEKEVEEEEE